MFPNEMRRFMADDRWVMYDGFSDKGAHSVEWFRIVKEFLKLAFAGGRHEAMCPCNRCCNRRMLSEYEMSGHIAKKGFIPDYLVWHQHREVQPPVAVDSNGNDDENRMDGMIADIGIEYDLGSEYQHPPSEMQNFYMLLAASKEKVHDGTTLTVLQAVTRLMAMKSKYNFSNQCYNDIVKLIIDLIPVKHNMLKNLYQSKKIVAGLGMNYEKIDACEKNYMLFCKERKDDLRYSGKELKVVFFQCDWFDPVNGTRVDDFGMVEVKHESRYSGINLLFAHQAQHVYYLSYPHSSLKNWWVVYKVNPEMHPA
jgi:hypothetical protein